MSYNDFIKSLKRNMPPSGLSETMKAMWYAKIGQWDRAHNIAQDNKTELGSWIHAYLHRIEGDQFNANYWYIKANRESSSLNLDDEDKKIIMYILDIEKGVL